MQLEQIQHTMASRAIAFLNTLSPKQRQHFMAIAEGLMTVTPTFFGANPAQVSYRSPYGSSDFGTRAGFGVSIGAKFHTTAANCDDNCSAIAW